MSEKDNLQEADGTPKVETPQEKSAIPNEVLGTSEVENEVPFETLKNEYYGLAIFLKKKLKFEDKTLDVIDKEETHWFWGTIWNSAGIYRDVLLASFFINLFTLSLPKC